MTSAKPKKISVGFLEKMILAAATRRRPDAVRPAEATPPARDFSKLAASAPFLGAAGSGRFLRNPKP